MTQSSFATRSLRQLVHPPLADRLRPLEAAALRSATQVTFCVRGVISPILANVYLHYVYDLWTHRWRRKATGDVIVIRYAGDAIVGFQHEHEAKAFLHDLQERMREFELALHPAKTRLIRSVAMRPSNVRNWERG